MDPAALKCMSESCISDLELSFYATQSWKGIWHQIRDIFMLEFPILPLGEETDEERVLLDWDLKQTACYNNFHNFDIFVINGIEKNGLSSA